MNGKDMAGKDKSISSRRKFLAMGAYATLGVPALATAGKELETDKRTDELLDSSAGGSTDEKFFTSEPGW